MPSNQLKTLLENVGLSTQAEDCAIVSINNTQFLLTNIDIFTAIHDDPYIMGKIAACNVTNDLFALNAYKVDSYNNFIGIPSDMPPHFSELIIKGIQDFLKPLGGQINGGHTIYNPWPLFGGAASSIIAKEHVIRKNGIKNGDIVMMTKPLGVQPIMAAYRVLEEDATWLEGYDIDLVCHSISLATTLMTTSNQPISQLIHNKNWFLNVHAMTDITGFGIAGHLEEMISTSKLGIEISELPVLINSPQLAELFGYQLKEGYSPEIAGGMLMSVSPEIYPDLVVELESKKINHYKLGQISNQLSGIKITPEVQLIEIEDLEL